MWTEQVLFMGAFGIVFILIGVALFVAGFKMKRRHEQKKYSYISSDHPIAWIAGAPFTLLGIFLLIGALFPFDTEYLQYQEVSGTIISIESRIVDEGSGISEKYVVRLDTGEGTREVACLDTRCALAETDDQIHLNCVRDWDWQAEHGYNCKFLGLD